MSLKKKDPKASSGLRVAANDPHLVSLGGGRLSTAVTIHYIPIGHMTIGSSPTCSVSLNGSGVRALHCTVCRNEEGEVTIVPEEDARVLIDGNKITSETNLTQGAMLTVGNSNYLRFNNPAEAQLIRSAMGSNERISMPQIDFTQDPNGSNRATPDDVLKNFNSVLESQTYQKQNNETMLEKMSKVEYININNFLSPKVFTADSVTVNTPAKDVLGPKYASFAKNLAENHRNDKNFCTKNNEMNIKSSNYVNIPTSFIQNSPNSSNEVLTKVNNYVGARNQQVFSSTYDRYPKPGSYGGLQLFPMNGLNSEINTCPTEAERKLEEERQQAEKARINEQRISAQEQERVDEILKMCAEYDRQNQSVQSSPIVQNRIKTNGSLPREKKSPFYDLGSQSAHNSKSFFPDKPKSSTGYENVRINGDRRIEIGSPSPQIISSGYENVIVGKYIPQSPRTKIRTTCVSPKKESYIISPPSSHHHLQSTQQATEYAHLIHSFEEKLKLEMKAIKENGKGTEVRQYKSHNETQKRRQNRNINNLTLDLGHSMDNINKKDNLDDLKKQRESVLSKIRKLKTQIAELQRQEDEVIREMNMEKALVAAELSSVNTNIMEMEKKFINLQAKIHRLEASRNANRVMQETQQSKLKQTIEMKQEQITRVEKLLQDNKSDDSLKEDLDKTSESLENDRKMFEDLEFQYLEEETDWLAYREELHSDLKVLSKHLDEKRMQMLRLESQGVQNQNTACSDTKTLENNLLCLLTMLEKSREELQSIDRNIFEVSGQQQSQSDSDDEGVLNDAQGPINNIMSQSLFGSTEILSSKPKEIDIMSRSVNENMFFNNIEMPSQSTPKKELKIFTINEDINGSSSTKTTSKKRSEDTNRKCITPDIVRRECNGEKDPLLKLKYNIETPTDDSQAKVNLNLSLGSDDFEVNPLDKRMPSQDDIDRICKVTLDAPISTQGASSKIIESIKEIERNRQLLLAQQGSHVIEHERQKMMELKKKSHDEARALYLSSQSVTHNGIAEKSEAFDTPEDEQTEDAKALREEDPLRDELADQPSSQQQRHSNPELESQPSRPLSDANSEISYDNLSEKPFKSTDDLGSDTNRLSENSEDGKRSSINSTDTTDDDRLVSGSKRNLPKHQRPLTRYLPIFSTDLDLRQHIESAGHQIALCPHVVVDSCSCRGYLHKLGATFHGWSRRWFVLDRKKNAFIYYSDKSERKPRGGAYFSTIDEVYLDHLNTSKSCRPHCTFIVKTKKRSYHLQAASDAAARIWIDAIITGAQGNIDY